MEARSIDINFLYLVISVIVLIFVYGMLVRTQSYIHKKKIMIEAEKNAYLIAGDVCESHLNNIKKNIIMLYKSVDVTKCKNLKAYIQQAHDDLNKFTGFAREPNDDDLIRYELINNLEILKVDSDDIELKKMFASVVLDIEAIIYLLRSSSCGDKRLVLKSLHKLLWTLYKNQCSGGSTYEEVHGREPFSGDVEKDIPSPVAKTSLRGVPRSERVSQSQDVSYDMNGEEYINQTETLAYKCDVPAKNPIIKKELVSQEFECSSDYILSYKGSHPYVPFCDIDKMREERDKLRALTLDINCARSLRNDYDYLDA
jgi:hypothetical protein